MKIRAPAQIFTAHQATEERETLGIPPHWVDSCEDSHHVGHDDSNGSLDKRVDTMIGNLDTEEEKWFVKKVEQLGSYGGGNHFGECEAMELFNPNANGVGSDGQQRARRWRGG